MKILPILLSPLLASATTFDHAAVAKCVENEHAPLKMQVAKEAPACIEALPTPCALAAATKAAPDINEGAWPDSQIPEGCPFPQSTDITGMAFTGRHAEYTGADTWFPSWASDNKMYSPWTDGVVNRVVSLGGAPNSRSGYATIIGEDPLKLKVVDAGVYKSDPAPYHGRYPCGSLVYNGVWYYGTYSLHPAGCVMYKGNFYGCSSIGPFVGFRWSTDFGKTWTQTPCTPAKPLFGECPQVYREYIRDNKKPYPVYTEHTLRGEPVKIGAPHFVDFGKNMEHSPDGKAYLIAHGGSDGKDRRFAYNSWINGDEIYLLRVTPSIENMNDASQYEFFDGTGWTKDFSKIKPIVSWRDKMGCVSMTYNAPLKKYLMCVTDGRDTVRKFDSYILESDQITGPFKMVQYLHDFGEQAYFLNIPSKFISTDGRTLWLCYSANYGLNFKLPLKSNPPGSKYAMCLQEIRLSETDDSKQGPDKQDKPKP